MAKCLTTSDLNEVNDNINSLLHRIDSNSAQISLNTEIKDNIIEVSHMPKQIQDLSLSVLRIENDNVEKERKVANNKKRLDEMEKIFNRSQNI